MAIQMGIIPLQGTLVTSLSSSGAMNSWHGIHSYFFLNSCFNLFASGWNRIANLFLMATFPSNLFAMPWLVTSKSVRNVILLFGAFAFCSFIFRKERPTLYIIGDSTVRNGDDTGKNGQWGWGSFLADYFDTTKIKVENDAIGGRSSRTFITEGRWDKILSQMKKGDFVIMQFGHNDSGPLDDTARARGTIRGTGDESKEIYNPITKKNEVVRTYGWYMKKYVDDTRAKGATAILCSPIPRNEWDNSKMRRSDTTYGGWAKEVAQNGNAYFIDLNNKIADQYELLGQQKVTSFFPADHTHTNREGALLNTKIVAEELSKLKGKPFKKYLLGKNY